MKKLFFFVVFVLISTITMAQSVKIFVDDKPSTMEEIKNIPASLIESVRNSVEDGGAVMRIYLKKGNVANEQNKPTEIKDNVGMVAELDQSTILKAGDVAADFTAQTYGGNEVKLSDYKGKVVLLNFWATWCAPCLRELAPDGLPMVLKQFADNPDFVFIPVAYTDTKEKLAAFFATENGKTIYNYLSLITLTDADKNIFSLYAKSGVPRSFVIGKDGKIIFCSLGARAEELTKIETAIINALK